MFSLKLRKKLFFDFLVTDFLVSKSSHGDEKQPVLGPAERWNPT